MPPVAQPAQPLQSPPSAYPAPSAQAYPGAAPSYPPAPQPYAGPAPSYPAAPVYPGTQQSGYGAPAPQPGGYPVYGAPMPAAYAQPRPTSGLAVTSLVCGLAGLLLSWLFVPMLASVAAVITGHLALGQTKKNPGIGGRGMAFAGLILGYVVIAFLVLGLASMLISVVFLGAFSLPFMFNS